MYQVYGINNCQTVKKTLHWLRQHEIPFNFHDYKKEGVDPRQLKEWCRQKGWEALLNKKGLTWRRLDAATREKIVDATTAISLMEAKTSIIKRPLIENNGKVLLIGFEEQQYKKQLL